MIIKHRNVQIVTVLIVSRFKVILMDDLVFPIWKDREVNYSIHLGFLQEEHSCELDFI